MSKRKRINRIEKIDLMAKYLERELMQGRGHPGRGQGKEEE